jgi:hypothetical protein
MKYLLCSGEMEKAKVAYTVNRKGYHLFIEKIPAYAYHQGFKEVDLARFVLFGGKERQAAKRCRGHKKGV